MRRIKSFTLVELVAVCALLAILAAIVAPGIGRQVLQARVAAEAAALDRLGAAVQASFESTDLEGTNLAALPGAIPSATDPTRFSLSTDPTVVPSTTNAFDWFAKISRQMGTVPQVGAAPLLQPQLAAVLLNPSRNARVMLVGPASEAAQQRFLILSLMAPAGQLALPPLPNPSNPQDAANLALFNDTWNTDWTNPAAVLPPSWASALSGPQVQAWQGSGSSPGRMWLLGVERIVCPKYTLTINDTHPADNAYVYYNFDGAVAGGSATVAANTGAFVIPGILSGRLIQAFRGAAPPPAAQLFSQFNLRDNCEITLQD